MKKENMMTTLYRNLLVLLLLGSSLALGSNAMSATMPPMPEFQRLDSIVNRTGNPTSVAVDSQGRLYVAEMLDNKISVFSQGGKLLATRYNVGKPVSIEVDTATDTVYVGSLADGAVTAYTSSFNRKFRINGFGHPADIAVDSANRIYVADKDNGVIKVFNSDGTPALTIGSEGSSNGQLHQPTGIAIDEAHSELVVLDHQLTFDIFANSDVEGARLQYFAMNGNFKRGYSKFGYKMELGQLVRPVEVDVDSQGRTYVTDSRLNKVMVYANNGSFLGMIDNGQHPLRAPLGVAITDSNLLYVTFSRSSDKGVDVYGLDAFSASLVDPTHLTFSATYGGNDPQTQPLTINNLGNTPLDWTAASKNEWVTIGTTAGTIDASAGGTTDVTVNIGSFDPGKYNGSLSIQADTGATEDVTVTLTVKPNPLTISPAGVDVTTTVGTTPASQTLSIANIAEGTLNWKATAGENWMTLSAETGTTPATIKLNIDATGLTVGNYSGTVTVMQEGDNPCPIDVPVTLAVNETTAPPSSSEQTPGVGSEIKIRSKLWTMAAPLDGGPLAGTALNGVWGVDGTNVIAVGDAGTILRYDGETWTAASVGSNNLNSVWGSAADNIYAVGDNATMLHSTDGTTWASTGAATGDLQDVGIDHETVSDFTSIWGSASDDIFRVGEAGLIEHFDGATWNDMTFETTATLNSVWGTSPDNVIAVGDACTILQYDGTTWTDMNPAGEQHVVCGDLNGVWGSKGKDVYAVGTVGNVLHYNGKKWRLIMTDASNRIILNDVWSSTRSFVVAVGEGGLVLTGKQKSFPWNTIIRAITTGNALKLQAEKDKEEQK